MVEIHLPYGGARARPSAADAGDGIPDRLRRLPHRDSGCLTVLADVLCEVAKVRARRGAPASTEDLFDEAVLRRNTSPESVAPELLFRIQSLLAYDCDRAGREYDAIRHYEESLKLAADCGSLDPIETVIVHNNLAMLYSRLDDFARAERHYLAAVAPLEGTHDENDPRVAAVHNNLGVLYFENKEFERARAEHNKALRIRRRIHGGASLHPDLCQTYENLASLHAAMGDIKTSRVYRDRVREIRTGTPPMSSAQRSHRGRPDPAESNRAG